MAGSSLGDSISLTEELNPLAIAPMLKKSKQKQFRRLLLEKLDQRELMAADASIIFSNAPESLLIGESASMTLEFSNAQLGESQVGYGPYVDLVLPAAGVDGDDGLQFDPGSARLFDSAIESLELEFGSTGKLQHPFALDSHGARVELTANPGDQLIVFLLPIGSYVSDQPSLEIDFDVTLSDKADVGIEHPIQAFAGYRYGSDALDNPLHDPMIRSSVSNIVFTPEVAVTNIHYVGPENETTVGSNFLRQYEVELDIATGVELKDLDLKAILGQQHVFRDLDSNIDWQTIVTPDDSDPNSVVNLKLDALIGKEGIDASYLVTFHTSTAQTSHGQGVSPLTGQSATSEFSVSTNASWQPLDHRDQTDDGLLPLVSDVSVAHELQDQAIAIQESIRLYGDQGAPGLSASDTVEYVLDFQIADHVTLDNLLLSVSVPNGHQFRGMQDARFFLSGANKEPLLNVPFQSGQGGLVTPRVGDSDQVVFDLGAELRSRGLSSILRGGELDGSQGTAVSGRVTFLADIGERFDSIPASGDMSIDEGDKFYSKATISGEILDPESGQATNHIASDASEASIQIPVGSLATEVYAINGDTSFGQPSVQSGDEVTLRIQRRIRSSDIENLVISEYLPMPVLEAGADFAFTNAGDLKFGEIQLGPTDTFHKNFSVEPTAQFDGSRNLLEFDYGSFDSDENESTVIDLLVTLRVTDQPFADGLWLNSHASSSQGTSNNGEFEMSAFAALQYTRPVLEIHKGIVSSDNPNASFAGTTGPNSVTFSAPGSATSFEGKFNHQRFAKRPVDADVGNIDSGDLIRVAVVIENVGQGTAGAHEVTLRDAVPEGFKIPASGLNLTVSDGQGNLLRFSNVESSEEFAFFESGIRLRDEVSNVHSADGTNFVIVTYDLEVSEEVEFGFAASTKAEVLHYAAQPLGNNFVNSELSDAAKQTVALPAVLHELIDTDQQFTSGTDVAIGENASYRVIVQVPEASTTGAQIRIDLPRGMAINNLQSVSWTDGLRFSKSAEEIIASARIEDRGQNERNQGRILILDLGDMTNANRNNAHVEALVIEYDATITNDLQNNDGDKRRAKATFSHNTGVSVSKSEKVKIVESNLSVERSFSSANVDAADIVNATITIFHDESRADAFDVSFSESLPEAWEFIPDSVVATGIDVSEIQVQDGTLSAFLARLPMGQSFTIQYSFRVADDVHAGQSLAADAEITWTSLEGEPGLISEHNALSHERTGNTASAGGDANYYALRSTGTLQVISPKIQTSLVDTSSSSTNGSALTIGEHATFEIQVTVPEGVHELQLGLISPIEGAQIQFTNIQLVHLGANLTRGDGETANQANKLRIDKDGNVALGTISNAADNISDANDMLTLRLTAQLLDEPGSANNELVKLATSLDFAFGQVSDSETITVAEPGIITSVERDSGVDAGQVQEVRLTLSHNPKFGAEPQNVVFTGYSGSDGLEFVSGSVELSNGEILSGNDRKDKAAKIIIPRLSVGESATLILQVRISEQVSPGESLKWLGITEWESLGDGTGRNYAASQEVEFKVNSSTISGWAFVDENQDGKRDAEDFSLVGSLITLTGIDHLGEPVQLQSQVGSSGAYQFENLRPGNYTLSHEQLSTFSDGLDYAGSLGGQSAGDQITNITLPTEVASTATNYNFTESSLSWISGTVFVDHSQNGKLGSDEEGIANVVVTLRGTSEAGEAITRETQTNSRGYYVFDSLPGGTYSLVQSQPEGYFDAAEQLGTGGGEAGNDSFASIKIDAGKPGEYYNFGEYEPSTLEGQLYIDYDRDEIRDRLDGLLAGLEVILTGVNDLGEEVQATTHSSLDGTYRFEGLRPGSYAISSVPVQGLDEGVSNVGIFKGGANSHAANGIAVAYGFESITLPEGTTGEAYDIGHIDPNHIESQLAAEFDNHYVLAGTDEADQIDVQLSTEEAVIQINEDTYRFNSNDQIAFSVIGFFGNDSISISGSEHKEEINIRSDSARLTGTWFSGLFYGMESIHFDGGGNEDVARFYDNAGDSQLDASPFEATWASAGYRHSVADIHRIYAYALNGGHDTANLLGSEKRDNFIATPDNARMYDGDYYIWVEGFDTVNAKANDLRDRAYLYGDTDSPDHLVASEHNAKLRGQDYELNAASFRYVITNGGAGIQDRAELIGTYEDDYLHSRPTATTFDADETRIVAKGFENVDVDAVQGNDVARLHDTHFDDVFKANAEFASISNSVSTVNAKGFDSVTAFALAGGNDQAIVEGGNGRDTFRGWSDKWTLEGQQFELAGYGFTQVIASATDGADRAYLYDTAGNDVLELRNDFASLSGERFSNQAVGYKRVVAEATEGGLDRVVYHDDDARSTVRFNGEKLTVFGKGFSNNAIGFDVVDALYADLAGNDRVELAEDILLDMILEDTEEIRYRLSLAAGPAGSAEAIKDRVANLPRNE